MNKLRAFSLRPLLHDQRGLTTVEYVIVLCLIAAVGVATWQSFGEKVEHYVGKANEKIMNELEKSQ